jgi:YbbR domain-containing protein
LKNIRIPHPLYINVRESLYKVPGSEYRYYLPISKFGLDLNRQLNSKTTLLSVQPDTLFLQIKEVESKKVPVRPRFTIELPSQYKPYGQVKVKPDSITVSGLDMYLDTLEFVATQPFKVKDVEKSKYNVPIAAAYKTQGMHISDDEFTVHFDIEKFTEEQRTLPLYVYNQPDTIQVKTFPSEVEISYLLAIKDYNKIAGSDFKAYIDYTDIKSEKNTLRVKLDEYPDQVEVNNISPEKVEFIIIKND